MTVTEASRNFSEVISRVYYSGEELMLTRGKRAVARLLPARKRSTGTDLLEWIKNRPTMSKRDRESFAADIEAGRHALNVPPVSKFDLLKKPASALACMT